MLSLVVAAGTAVVVSGWELADETAGSRWLLGRSM